MRCNDLIAVPNIKEQNSTFAQITGISGTEMESSTSNRRMHETSGMRDPGTSVALQMKESKIGGSVGIMMCV